MKPSVNRLCLLLFLACSCKPADESGAKIFHDDDEPDYDDAKKLGLNAEYIPPNEEAFLREAANRFLTVHKDQQEKNQSKYQDQVVRRGMHAKGQGCLDGQFIVGNSDPRLAFGLFKTPATYQVKARLSNGSGVSQADGERDLRGFAVKVLGVPGPTLVDAPQSATQDFLMTSAPSHHAKDIVELMKYIEASNAGGVKNIAFLASHPHLALTLIKQTSRSVESLIKETYWSRTAYRLGPQQLMKFLAEPCTERKALASKDDGEDYLTEDLDLQAQAEEICFNFKVQLQSDPKHEPVEDFATEWKTPAQIVATIKFPKQTPDRSAACENLEYTPVNALVEHEGVGNFNRARRFIYAMAQEFRRSAPNRK
jgi:hypothetical protein